MRATFSTLILALAIVSCGKMQNVSTSSGGVGGVRSLALVAASTDQINEIQSLCSKLQQKDTNYIYYVNGYSRFNYDTTYRACDGVTTTDSVSPTLTSNGGLLMFALPPGQALATAVETATSGQISQICRAQTGLNYPVLTSSNQAVWYDTYKGGDCQSNDPDVLCVLLETGTKQLNGTYLITSSDKYMLDFSVGQESGTVIRHERYEQGGCAEGKSVARTSVFKNIN